MGDSRSGVDKDLRQTHSQSGQAPNVSSIARPQGDLKFMLDSNVEQTVKDVLRSLLSDQTTQLELKTLDSGVWRAIEHPNFSSICKNSDGTVTVTMKEPEKFDFGSYTTIRLNIDPSSGAVISLKALAVGVEQTQYIGDMQSDKKEEFYRKLQGRLPQLNANPSSQESSL